MDRSYQNYESLDIIRAFASLSVVFFHLMVRFEPDYYFYQSAYPKYIEMFEKGVALFFMLSGYLISISLHNTKIFSNFAVKRFSKIYPTYCLCIIISFVFINYFGLPGRESSLIDFFANFVFLNQFKAFQSIDGAYWSLAVEVNFYLFISVLFYRFKSLFKATLILSSVSLGLFLITELLDYRSLNYFINTILFSKKIGFFLIGTTYFLIEKRIISFTQSLIFTPYIIYSIFINYNYTIYHYLYLPLAIFIFIFFTHYKNKLKRIPKSIKFFSLISYPMYLLHQNLGTLIIRELNSYVSNDNLKLFISFSFITILSSLIYYCYEKPVAKKIRKSFTL